MIDILYIQAKNHPNKTFITYNNQIISYMDFNNMTNNIIKTIQKDKQKYIGVQIQDHLKLLTTIIAINRLKKIPILYPNYSNIKDFINITNIPVSIKDDNIIINKSKTKNLKVTYNKNNTQMVMFTSGTTGYPKACELSYNNLYQSTVLWNHIIQFKNSDCYLNHMPLTHISGISIFLRALYCNFEMVIDKFDVKNYMQLINNNKINIISMVPSMFYKIVKIHDIKIFEKLKAIIIGGSKINNEMLNIIKKNKIPAYISYGMTETSSGIAGFWANQKNIYKAHKDVDISVDKSKIKISSNVVMTKYMNNKKTYGILQTNDIGEMHGEKLFSIKNRTDNIVNSGGEKFSSIQIKNIIEKLEEVQHCKIKIIKDKEWGQIVHAYIKVNIKLRKYNLLDKIKEKLPPYMVPKKIFINQ